MPGMVLSQARVVRRWCSVVGSLEGCLRAQGIDHSAAYVMGASGHAFRINVEPVHLCRSASTVIDFRGDHLPLYNNLGLRFELRQHWTDEPAYLAKQKVVWESINDCLDSRRPAIVWDADAPEFGLVIGREPRGGQYTFSTMPNPDPWQASKNEVPRTVGILRVFVPVERKSCDPRKAASDSLAFAIRHSRGANCYEDYQGGMAAYEAWMTAMQEGRVLRDPFSHAYNVAVVNEARSFVPAYLREVASYFAPAQAALVQQAAVEYDEVAQGWRRLHRLFPVSGERPQVRPDMLATGVKELQRAYAHEQRAVDLLCDAFPDVAALDDIWTWSA